MSGDIFARRAAERIEASQFRARRQAQHIASFHRMLESARAANRKRRRARRLKALALLLAALSLAAILAAVAVSL